MAKARKVAATKCSAAKKKTVRKRSRECETPTRMILSEGDGNNPEKEEAKTKTENSQKKKPIRKNEKAGTRIENGPTKTGVKNKQERPAKPRREIGINGKASTIESASPKTEKAGTRNQTDPTKVTHAVQQARKDGPEGEDLRQTAPKRKARRLPSLSRMERDVRFVLMDLMATSDSDSVRVAAAKALMDKVNKEQGEVTDEQERRTKERDDAIAEAGRLLVELAALKSYGARHKAKVA